MLRQINEVGRSSSTSTIYSATTYSLQRLLHAPQMTWWTGWRAVGYGGEDALLTTEE